MYKSHILKGELTTENIQINLCTTIQDLSIPVVAYSFNIVDWKLEKVRKLDRKTRKL